MLKIFLNVSDHFESHELTSYENYFMCSCYEQQLTQLFN